MSDLGCFFSNYSDYAAVSRKLPKRVLALVDKFHAAEILWILDEDAYV